MLTRDLIVEMFYYKDGHLYHKRDTKGRLIKGNPVGSIDISYGSDLKYLRTKINGSSYKVHRLVWIYHYGEISDFKMIDHIDGNGLNNNIENLRLTTASGNNKNAKIRKDNKSGYQGVSWYKNRNMWRVSIGNNGKQETVGYFLDLEDAINARKEKEKEYGYHKNHGRK